MFLIKWVQWVTMRRNVADQTMYRLMSHLQTDADGLFILVYSIADRVDPWIGMITYSFQLTTIPSLWHKNYPILDFCRSVVNPFSTTVQGLEPCPCSRGDSNEILMMRDRSQSNLFLTIGLFRENGLPKHIFCIRRSFPLSRTFVDACACHPCLEQHLSAQETYLAFAIPAFLYRYWYDC
jgi:hypothetical protein